MTSDEVNLVHFEEVLPHRSNLHLSRKIWHMAGGLTIVLIFEFSGISRQAAVAMLGLVFGFFIAAEMLRLMNPAVNHFAVRLWRPFMRADEVNRMSTSTFFIGSAMLTLAIFPEPIAILSLLYLAFGDPVASFAGILYGHLGPRFSSGKSLIGTLANGVVCGLLTLVLLSGMPIGVGKLLVLALVGGASAAVAELLPLEIDDNFTIPLISGFALWLAFISLGV